ncbi:amino acid ABC transporter substrate-binding protein [Phaeobacter marinintestinus]|uniref:amino acid ABC transporter substrate-binding protein n=1 Tax=Falsiphaeobacter marinintestinus TaxID=1492905 RepID=UPI001648114E|nr:amino acid ABC transporter substrate-binding protein [Phaeobacter marinintestinus]
MRMLPLSTLVAAALALPVTAQTIDRITETGELRLGYRIDAAPLSFADEAGLPAGYSVLLCAEIAQGIANALKMEELNADFFAISPTDRFDKVAAGEIDLLCGAATITLGRRALVDFSIPTFVDGAALMLPADAPGQFADLKGKRIGVRGATTTEEALNNSLTRSGIEAEVVAFDAHDQGMEAMKAGEIDAYFADQSILLYLQATSGAHNDFKVSNEILSIEKQGLALARGDTDFRLMVDSIVSELYKNGKMEEIFATTMPGATAGNALRALHLIAPTLP